jgi:hypothetical protein
MIEIAPESRATSYTTGPSVAARRMARCRRQVNISACMTPSHRGNSARRCLSTPLDCFRLLALLRRFFRRPPLLESSNDRRPAGAAEFPFRFLRRLLRHRSILQRRPSLPLCLSDGFAPRSTHLAPGTRCRCSYLLPRAHGAEFRELLVQTALLFSEAKYGRVNYLVRKP